MQMPGFTAEKSMHETTKHYGFAAGWEDDGGSQRVIPQYTLCTGCICGRRLCCWTKWGWPPIGCGLRSC